MNPPIQRDHIDAVVAALETEFGGLNIEVGDAIAPRSNPPYVVVYPINGGYSSGTLADHTEDQQIVVQVSCIGLSRQQTQWLADHANVLLDGLEVAERYIPLVTLDMPSGVYRDDDQTPPIFTATPRYRIFSTPNPTES